MTALLDNIMWNCLSGPHAKFAVGEGAVRRYAPGFSPIIGCEDPQRPDFDTLARFCEPGDFFYTDLWSGEAPAGWRLERDAFDKRLERERPLRERDEIDIAAQSIELSVAGSEVERDVPALLEDANLPHPLARHTARRDVRHRA